MKAWWHPEPTWRRVLRPVVDAAPGGLVRKGAATGAAVVAVTVASAVASAIRQREERR